MGKCVCVSIGISQMCMGDCVVTMCVDVIGSVHMCSAWVCTCICMYVVLVYVL